MSKTKVGEANGMALLQYFQANSEEVGNMHQKMKEDKDSKIDSIAASFVHMIMMNNNENPSDKNRREQIMQDGINRYNSGSLIIEKKNNLYEIFLIK